MFLELFEVFARTPDHYKNSLWGALIKYCSTMHQNLLQFAALFSVETSVELVCIIVSTSPAIYSYVNAIIVMLFCCIIMNEYYYCY